MYLASFYDECRYFAITIFLNSPLIGVSFCKRYQRKLVFKQELRFRPLIGVSFCKQDL